MDFEVQRADLATTRFIDPDRPELADGQVRVQVEAFALTANNITYGVFGDALRYWEFFPASGDEGWGRLPAFGFARVEESTHPDVATGLRVFGYLPMSTEVVMSPTRAGEHGFTDGAPHRQAMAAAYNGYRAVDEAGSSGSDHDPHRMLLQPLFMTAFVVEDSLHDDGGYGASTVVISSASSKTSIATAFQLRERATSEVVGLTSPGNRDFVVGLDIYDRVLTYDQVGDLQAAPTVYVDTSADGSLRHAVHAHLGSDLVHDMALGATHWEESTAPADLPGPTPTMFFAPDQIAKRTEEWGREGFDARLEAAWSRYLDWADGWLDVVRGHGPDAVEAAYREVLRGGSDPRTGHILSMHVET